MLDTEKVKESLRSGRLSRPNQKVKSSGPGQLFCAFFGYLAFQGHGVRIGLEITASLFMFIAITESIPSSGQASSVHWVTLASWFAACGIVAAADWFVFSHPRHTYRTSLRLGLCGSYDKALALLDTIGPQSS